jgi:transcriptional regulator with XRE-family HTH domain
MGLSAKLKQLRIQKKKSLQDVAEAVGASKAHIWDLETGRSTNPGIDLLKKLADCFEVSVAELIGEDPTATNEDPMVVAMYRELKELTPEDRKALRVMIDHLRAKKDRE